MAIDHGRENAVKPRFIETLARRGYRFIGTVNATPRQIESLAVLPLENLSRDPEHEYFAEGLTEALITTLAKIGELRVVSRTSIILYKGVSKPLDEIAWELEVDAIVEGTVLREGVSTPNPSTDTVSPYDLTSQGKAQSGNGINYHGGPVMPGTVNAYFIWYGNWVNGPNQSDSHLTVGLLSMLYGSGGLGRFWLRPD
jgi:hypothetical protein